MKSDDWLFEYVPCGRPVLHFFPLQWTSHHAYLKGFNRCWHEMINHFDVTECNCFPPTTQNLLVTLHQPVMSKFAPLALPEIEIISGSLQSSVRALERFVSYCYLRYLLWYGSTRLITMSMKNWSQHTTECEFEQFNWASLLMIHITTSYKHRRLCIHAVPCRSEHGVLIKWLFAKVVFCQILIAKTYA